MARKKDQQKVASVAVFSSDGRLLFGKRNDTGKYTLPGGHCEEDEAPEVAAKRELFEEAGLKSDKLEFLGEGVAGRNNNIRVYCYKVTLNGKPTSVNDPDKECDEWLWIDVEDGVPTYISENLHSPKNITLRLLNLQSGPIKKQELTAIGFEYSDLENRLKKLLLNGPSDPSEVQKLLTDPHPLVRLIALRLPVINNSWLDVCVDYNTEPEWRNRAIAALRKDLNEAQITKLLKDINQTVAIGVIKNYILTEQQIAIGLSDLRSGVREAVVQYQKLNDNQIHKALGDDDVAVRIAAIHRNDLKEDHIYRACYDDNIEVAEEALHKASDSQLYRLRSNAVKYKYINIVNSEIAIRSRDSLNKSEVLDKKILDPTEGYKIHHVHHDLGDGEYLTEVRASLNGDYVGGAHFSHFNNKQDLFPEIVSVSPQHRRKGIASAMYAHAEKVTGKKIVPSYDQTPEGKALWAGNAQSPQFGKSIKGGIAAGLLSLPTIASAAGPAGADKQLSSIAHLESSGGKNIQHQAHSKGDFHTAYGAVGLKPITAHFEYSRSKELKQKYPNLNEPADFLKEFKNNPQLYNDAAKAHWGHLRGIFNSHGKAAYAWRHGTRAAATASDDQINNDKYVQSFLKLIQDIPPDPAIKKSESNKRSLYVHPDHNERMLALKSKQTSDQELIRALFDEHPAVRMAAMDHPQFDDRMMLAALHPKAPHDVKVMALSRAKPNHLTHVHADPDPQIRHIVASRQDLSPNVYLEMLSNEIWPSIRELLIKNPQLPIEALTQLGQAALSHDYSRGTAPFYIYEGRNAMRHPNMPANLLAAGAMHPILKWDVIENPSLDRFVRYHLQTNYHEPDWQLRLKSLQHPETNTLHLAMGLYDPHPQIRKEAQARLGSLGLHKSLDDIKPGAKLEQYKLPALGAGAEQNDISPSMVNPFVSPVHKKNFHINGVYDYTHVLPEPIRKQGYQLHVYDGHASYAPRFMIRQVMVHRVDPHTRRHESFGRVAGSIVNHLGDTALDIDMAVLHPKMRRKGVGMAMYEALAAHAKHVDGATHIMGGLHSSKAAKAHAALAAKHGMDYHPPQMEGLGGKEGSFDQRFGPYKYLMRSEDLIKNIGYISYPLLGQSGPATQPFYRKPLEHEKFRAAVTGRSRGESGFVHYPAGSKPTSPKDRSMVAATNTVNLGTMGHEAQHTVFGALRQKYGINITNNIIGRTLNSLLPEDRQHLDSLTEWGLSSYHPDAHPEEQLVRLQNYLQDKNHRAKAHRAMGIRNNREAQKQSQTHALQIWQKLRSYASQLTPESVGIKKINKAMHDPEWNKIAAWHDEKQTGLVDSNKHHEMHPRAIQPEVELSHQTILHPEKQFKALPRRSLESIEVSPKKVYNLGGGNKAMVKPYFEKVTHATSEIQHHGLSGWAEMATQGLFHAGGIGNLTQKVHTFNNKVHGKTIPSYAVHLDPDASTLEESSFRTVPSEERPKLRSDAMKIGMIDYLTNNNDRHGYNLMINNNNKNLLAIDHGRNFNYKSPNRWVMNHTPGEEDHPMYYLTHSVAMKKLASTKTGGVLTDQSMNDAVEWWKQHGDSIRNEFGKHLELIKDPKLKDFINNNFHERANMLDKMARYWDQAKERGNVDVHDFAPSTDYGYYGADLFHPMDRSFGTHAKTIVDTHNFPNLHGSTANINPETAFASPPQADVGLEDTRSAQQRAADDFHQEEFGDLLTPEKPSIATAGARPGNIK